MLKSIQRKSFLCLVLAMTLAFMINTTAADKPLSHTATQVAAVDAKDNDLHTTEFAYDFGESPTISAFQNPDGSYALCIQQNDGSLKIAEITAQGVLASQLTVYKELDSYVAFTKGSDGSYYILFNQKLTPKQKYKTALRLVNYSAEGERLREFNISGIPGGSVLGIAEVFAGNNVLCANDSLITGYIGRDMFPANDGVTHQASYAFAFDLKTGKQIEIDHSVKIPYVSHSFHQFILKDGNDFIYADRGDAEPFRSFRISKMSGTAWRKDPSTYVGLNGRGEEEYKRGNSFRFKGRYAENDTYGQLGGVVKTDSGYMLAGTYQNTTKEFTPSSANIFVQIFNPDTLDAQKEIYLTDYTESAQSLRELTATANNPKILSIDSNKVAIAYMLTNAAEKTEEMRIIFADSSGSLIEEKAVNFVQGGTNLPRYGNVYYSSQNDSIEWFGIEDGQLIMNSVSLTEKEEPETDESSTTPSEEETTASPDSESTTAPETTEPSTEQPPTEAPTEPAAPQEPSFFQRVIDFFEMIYNWFISLFS